MLGIRFELKQVTFLKNIVNFVHQKLSLKQQNSGKIVMAQQRQNTRT